MGFDEKFSPFPFIVPARQLARQKVRDAIQPGVIGNVLESEMNAVLSQIVNARLVQQRDAALDRAHYEHGGDGRYRNGFKPVSLGGLFGNWSISKPVLLLLSIGKVPLFERHWG